MSVLLTLAMTLVAGLPQSRLISYEPKLLFPRAGEQRVEMFNNISPKLNFHEMIASWNIEPANTAAFKLEVRVHGTDFVSKWFTMANWSLDSKLAPRESVKGQHDDDAYVDTDTLVLKKNAVSLDAKVTLQTLGEGPRANLKLLTFSFRSAEAPLPSPNHPSPAWGKSIAVPERAQGNYPNGGVLCSPTSMSMMLWHYSNVLNRPELNQDVPVVESHVWDPVYKGAGNWPFNTAYAGSFQGIRSYVARFESISNLESWIEEGLPVICSVSFDMLRGLPLSPTESGHLVVLVGFTKDGDPVINDPAFKHQVHKTYKRSDFEKAWAYSKRTVYLVYPENAKVPKDAEHLWMTSK